MKLTRLLMICLMGAALVWMAVGCDQESDDSDSGESKPMIGFNISYKLPSAETIKTAYPDVTGDWIIDMTEDAIDLVCVFFRENTSDASYQLAYSDKFVINDSSDDGTGTIYAYVSTNKLKTDKGLEIDVRLAKYKDKSKELKSSDDLYYLAMAKDHVVIESAVTSSYKNTFDVTADGIYTGLDISINVPTN